ncbi:hypothetical protein F5Y15DRAFT_371938 [Xylariaceae sp. FL0016]|nr:hypothetical protein F5Y15DRAFT_371938 [Xylariaceae sp. FL0016]
MSRLANRVDVTPAIHSTSGPGLDLSISTLIVWLLFFLPPSLWCAPVQSADASIVAACSVHTLVVRPRATRRTCPPLELLQQPQVPAAPTKVHLHRPLHTPCRALANSPALSDRKQHSQATNTSSLSIIDPDIPTAPTALLCNPRLCPSTSTVQFFTMPCFKGIAVSIHANSAPLAEYGMQKQSRLSRISTYIPVPQPQLNPDTSKHEAAKFAISITLLTPGHPIPYTQPKATDEDPSPKPLYAGPLPSTNSDPSKHANAVTPYIPMTHSENETIAAYIYFDGRAKEEVATLLRPGEETWVNSRWVQVPDSEGGGLAEREFLFREVGLERWLNGLDLQGHDAAEKVEKRRQKFERRHRRQKSTAQTGQDTGEERTHRTRDTLAYGGDDHPPSSPSMSDDDDSSLSDDDEPPEATGQIKVAMFRVIASGEIKKGEYSPQFDAHDDDDESDGNKAGSNGAIDADVEHTTSFAKPKTLDPKTISTQTVTGIDGPDQPYAVFTFFYRGQRQLTKMGLYPGVKDNQKTPSAKRRSTQLDFSGLGPLKSTGTVGFSAFRDQDAEAAKRRKSRKKGNGSGSGDMEQDSDDDDDDDDDPLSKMEDNDDKVVKTHLSPEDAKLTGELQSGIDRIRLKRQHSAEPDSGSSSGYRKSPSAGPMAGESSTSTEAKQSERPVNDSVSNLLSKAFSESPTVGSPLKKQRGNSEEEAQDRSANFPSAIGDVLGRATAEQKKKEAQPVAQDEEEEL